MSNLKEIQELEARIRELKELNIMKQIEIDFKSKMIDIAEDMYGIDIWKKFDSVNISKNDPSEEK